MEITVLEDRGLMDSSIGEKLCSSEAERGDKREDTKNLPLPLFTFFLFFFFSFCASPMTPAPHRLY